MASIQSRVMDAVVAALNTTAWRAYRTRFEPFTPPDPATGLGTDLPAYNVLPEEGGPDEANEETFPVQARVFSFNVRHMGYAVSGVDVAIDALYVAGVQAIMADPTLGGLVRVTYEGAQKWEFEDKGQYNEVALVVTYSVKFATTRSDPTALVP